MATNIRHKLYFLEVPPPPDVWADIAVRLKSEFNAEEVAAARKMYELSVPPPADVWSGIAVWLNNEFNAEEVAAAQKMYELSVPPPAAVWENIEAALELGQQQPVKHEGKVLHLPFYKVASAAAAMVVVTLAAWYFLNNSTNHNTGNATVVKPNSAGVAVENAVPSQQPAPPASFEPVTEQSNKEELAEAEKPNAAADVAMAANYSHSNERRMAHYSNYQPVATSYAGIDDVQTIPLTNDDNTPSVEAPLIRDAKGQIILDKKLITSPDDCYITITGPNGEQTRISSKFLHIISSLNDDAPPEDYFDFMLPENGMWKMRFQEWKDRFLKQASFIPTATNFTDILALKDLLQQENDPD